MSIFQSPIHNDKFRLCISQPGLRLQYYVKLISSSDSDYQLGSAAQTPGLNNSVTSTDYEVPAAHITPLTEAYIARDRAYAPQHVS